MNATKLTRLIKGAADLQRKVKQANESGILSQGSEGGILTNE
jgi:hypothetical protein